MYNWDFNSIFPYIFPLFKGLLVTLYISFTSIIIGTILGVILAFIRRSRIFLLRYFAVIFIEIFLAMPVLVLLIWTYYCLPLLINIRFSGHATAIIVFSLSLSAFIAETIRSGLGTVPQGQIEAAISLRLSTFQTYKYILLPQAIRYMIPALLTQYLTCIKLSSLASIIAVYELLHTADNIVSQTYRPLEIYTIVSILFLLVILPINILTRRIEKIVYLYNRPA